MAKAMGQYEKVLNVLKEANGADVSLDTFKQQCEVAGVNMYRISTYMWEIRPRQVRSYTRSLVTNIGLNSAYFLSPYYAVV